MNAEKTAGMAAIDDGKGKTAGKMREGTGRGHLGGPAGKARQARAPRAGTPANPL